MLPYQLVRVCGPSMVPTLRHGDVVLVRRGVAACPGDVVLARFRTMPDRYVLKRAVAEQDGGWQVASDNPFAGGDSRTHGVAEVLGRVVARWPSSRSWRGRVIPRRLQR